jgi:hypothetical protein
MGMKLRDPRTITDEGFYWASRPGEADYVPVRISPTAGNTTLCMSLIGSECELTLAEAANDGWLIGYQIELPA